MSLEDFERRLLLEAGQYTKGRGTEELAQRREAIEAELRALRRESQLLGLAIATRNGERGILWLSQLQTDGTKT